MYGYIGHTFPISGEVAGSLTAAQLPAGLQRKCKRVLIRARSDNAGSVFVGFTSGVTIANGSTDTTTGIELDATDDALSLDIQDSAQVWYICDNAGDDFTIIVM